MERLGSPAGRTGGGLRRLPWLAVWFACAACGGSTTSAADPSTIGEVTKRDTRVEHEDCDLESGNAQDVNKDGRPDLAVVGSGDSESCRAVDLNFDGVWDAWIYRGADGKVRRREADFDRDGRIDEISTYRGGVLATKHRATTLGGKLDTWQYYENGRLVRSERDSDGNAVVDQWWEYPKGAKADCPLVHSDVDGDGRPDPGATVDMCPPDEFGGEAPPPKAEPKPGAFETAAPPELTETVEGGETLKAPPAAATEKQ